MALQTSWQALRRSEQALARLRKAKALRSHRDWVAKRTVRTRHLIELGGLVVVARLTDRLEDDRALLLGALLMVGDLLEGAGIGWASVGSDDLVERWRERGRHALGPTKGAAAARPVLLDDRQAATRRIIKFGGLVMKAGLVRHVEDDRATLLGALLTIGYMLDDGGDDDLAHVSPSDLKVRWRRRGLRAFDREAEAKAESKSAGTQGAPDRGEAVMPSR